MTLTVYNERVVNKCLSEVSDRKDELDLVVLPGLMRTGTTVMFQCIRGTEGFRETHTARLLGTPPSEHQSWRIPNYLIGKHLGARAVNPNSASDIGHADVLYGKEYTISEKPLDDFLHSLMDEAMKVFTYQELRVLKEPMCQFALEAWIERYKSFRNAKYVWTRRDLLKTAKSLVRLKMSPFKGMKKGYRGIFGVKKALHTLRQGEAELERLMPKMNHIVVWHEDLITNPKKEFGRVAKFLGVPKLNTRAFDRGKVYESKKNC